MLSSKTIPGYKEAKDNPEELCRLGEICLEVKDYAQALKCFEAAAKQQNAIAQYKLGFMYSHGKGVRKDLVKAKIYYEQAAQAGLPVAMSNLGVFYHNQHNYIEAITWFTKAAVEGNITALRYLGELHHDGNGVKQDTTKAIHYFELAAIKNNKPAIEALKQLAKTSSTAILALLYISHKIDDKASAKEIYDEIKKSGRPAYKPYIDCLELLNAGKKVKALIAFDEALNTTQDKLLQVRILMTAAPVQIELNDPENINLDMALAKYRLAYQLADELSSHRKTILETLNELCNTYKTNQNCLEIYAVCSQQQAATATKEGYNRLAKRILNSALKHYDNFPDKKNKCFQQLMYQLAELHEKTNPARAFEHYFLLSESGHTEAQMKCAHALLYGELGQSPQQESAIALFQKITEQAISKNYFSMIKIMLDSLIPFRKICTSSKKIDAVFADILVFLRKKEKSAESKSLLELLTKNLDALILKSIDTLIAQKKNNVSTSSISQHLKNERDEKEPSISRSNSNQIQKIHTTATQQTTSPSMIDELKDAFERRKQKQSTASQSINTDTGLFKKKTEDQQVTHSNEDHASDTGKRSDNKNNMH